MQVRAISTIESMEELGLTASNGVPSFDMDAYMAALFGGEASNTCVESRVEQIIR